ncbi:MAG: hypothetical protein M1816_002941 [Peltula sp. TS41687]|nr:MAG: hypothetical protein M1816_002941 [Peltula sp. TS41687]
MSGYGPDEEDSVFPCRAEVGDEADIQFTQELSRYAYLASNRDHCSFVGYKQEDQCYPRWLASLLKYHGVLCTAADRYKIYHKLASALDEVRPTTTAAVLIRSLRCHMELLGEIPDAIIHTLEEKVDDTIVSDLARPSSKRLDKGYKMQKARENVSWRRSMMK